jgi:methanogenesis imperfect marker protein 11
LLTRDEIIEKIGERPWVSPYKRLVAVADEKNHVIQLYEDHARGTCFGGAGWETYHYFRTSELVIDARRDGARNVFTIKVGKGKLNLIPSFAGAGIEEAEITEDEIRVTYAGLAGGGVAVALARGLAPGPKGVIIHSMGGGRQLGRATLIFPKMLKITVGVDDTDSAGEGATWGLCNEIGYEISEKMGGVEYLHHTIVQLYPKAPKKTTNCVSIALTFGVLPEVEEKFIEEIKRMFKDRTSSDETGMAIFRGIIIPEELKKYADEVRRRFVEIEETERVASNCNVELHEITGSGGLIGALAAIGYAERTDEAVIPGVPFEEDVGRD